MQVVALAVDPAHPDVHVCRSPQNRPALLRYTLQGLLVGAHRLAEATLHEPDVGQRYRAAEGIGNVPGPPQSRHAFGVRRMPGLEVPARPEREPQTCPRPRHGRGGPPRAQVRAPAGRAGRCRAHRPEPGPGRHGTARSSPGGDDIPPRRPRPFLPNGPPISHRYRLSRPASARRPAAGSQLPRAHRPNSSAPANPTLSTGLTRTTSPGIASSQPRTMASCLVRLMAGIASSARSAARSKSPAASA